LWLRAREKVVAKSSPWGDEKRVAASAKVTGKDSGDDFDVFEPGPLH
jgi:hypothetical protein